MLLKIRHTLVKTAFLAVCSAMLINSDVWAQTGQILDVNSGETVEYVNIGNNYDNAVLNVNDGGTANKTSIYEDGLLMLMPVALLMMYWLMKKVLLI